MGRLNFSRILQPYRNTHEQYSNTTTTGLLFADRDIQIILYIAWAVNIITIIFILAFILFIRFAMSQSFDLNNRRILWAYTKASHGGTSPKNQGEIREKSMEYGTIKMLSPSDEIPEYNSLYVSDPVGSIQSHALEFDYTRSSRNLRNGKCVGNCSPAPTHHQSKWKEIEKERQQRLKDAIKKREEIQERQRRRREELMLERERMTNEMIAALINTLTHPLLEETRKFNDWLETPD